MPINLTSDAPALILAPMDGLTDAPMRAVQGEAGAFTFAVSEFLRVSSEVLGKREIHRHVPELLTDGRTRSGLPVQVQILGGHPERMARSAAVAVEAGARAVDINFGCPAPTVNRHDGGASLLRSPQRIREIVQTVRAALPPDVPVSVKMRLGWDSMDPVHENADMAAEGGAAWVTIHGRTRVQGYAPPAYWGPIGQVRARLGIPVVANGDIWTLEDFRRCQEETGCRHFMLGRGALADPRLSARVAREMGLPVRPRSGAEAVEEAGGETDWVPRLRRLVEAMELMHGGPTRQTLSRLKQWLKLGSRYGTFAEFDAIKRAQSVEELFTTLCREAD